MCAFAYIFGFNPSQLDNRNPVHKNAIEVLANLSIHMVWVSRHLCDAAFWLKVEQEQRYQHRRESKDNVPVIHSLVVQWGNASISRFQRNDQTSKVKACDLSWISDSPGISEVRVFVCSSIFTDSSISHPASQSDIQSANQTPNHQIF